MTKDLVVSASPRETRVALLEDGSVCEVFIERESRRGNVGNIFKGRVTRVLPGMQSAFVDIRVREVPLQANVPASKTLEIPDEPGTTAAGSDAEISTTPQTKPEHVVPEAPAPKPSPIPD